jgi:hypothetical protein
MNLIQASIECLVEALDIAGVKHDKPGNHFVKIRLDNLEGTIYSDGATLFFKWGSSTSMLRDHSIELCAPDCFKQVAEYLRATQKREDRAHMWLMLVVCAIFIIGLLVKGI